MAARSPILADRPIERFLDRLRASWRYVAGLHPVTDDQRVARAQAAVQEAQALGTHNEYSMERAIRRSLALQWGWPEDAFDVHVICVEQSDGWTAWRIAEGIDFRDTPLKGAFRVRRRLEPAQKQA